MVSTDDGYLHRIKWNASVNQKASFHIRGFLASLDFHQTKGTSTFQAISTWWKVYQFFKIIKCCFTFNWFTKMIKWTKMTANFWNYDMLLILACKLTGEDGCVQQMEYSPIIGGYNLVLTSGKALFVIPPSTKIENSVSSVTWSCSIDSVWGLHLTVLKETEKK